MGFRGPFFYFLIGACVITFEKLVKNYRFGTRMSMPKP
jgi:hypothetical protein